jgi:hypothetical protein
MERFEKYFLLASVIIGLAFVSTYVSFHLHKVEVDSSLRAGVTEYYTYYGWPLHWYFTAYIEPDVIHHDNLSTALFVTFAPPFLRCEFVLDNVFYATIYLTITVCIFTLPRLARRLKKQRVE